MLSLEAVFPVFPSSHPPVLEPLDLRLNCFSPFSTHWLEASCLCKVETKMQRLKCMFFKVWSFFVLLKAVPDPGSPVFEIPIFQTTSNKYDNRLGSNFANLGSFFFLIVNLNRLSPFWLHKNIYCQWLLLSLLFPLVKKKVNDKIQIYR